MKNILQAVRVTKFNKNIARITGEIIRDSNYTISFSDAAIAATAIYN